MDGTRKQLGAWYTPSELVELVVDAVVTPTWVSSRPTISVLDPACGDGRFLGAVDRRARALGVTADLTGTDVDSEAIESSRRRLAGTTAGLRHADALTTSWPSRRFDLVVGNPPFLSQLAASTTRGGSSRRGGGPYADVAAEFLALAAELVDPNGGRIALVLPQSLLASRDACAIRAAIGERAHMIWSWWTDRRLFDAQVFVCAVAFEFGTPEQPDRRANWSHVVAGRVGIPQVPSCLQADGTLGDRAQLNANFRDEYYGMVPAVGDHECGPRLLTSGLIDPGRSWWGQRSIRFAKRRHDRPRVDLARLDERMRRWAAQRLVPKVLVANQTRLVEAVCDPRGEWLPAVPVLGVYPTGAHWDDARTRTPDELADAAWEIAAALTSPLASAWLWHRGAGTGLAADAIRLSPATLAALPWPAGDLTPAVVALRDGDVRACGRAVDAAYGVGEDDELFDWWAGLLQRAELRHAAPRRSAPSG
jgi:SAM-dependent methyltransferase